jgi:hypothetical protein
MFERKFNKNLKNLFGFLLIILSLSSLNIFTMRHKEKRIDMQNLSYDEKLELTSNQKQVSEIKKMSAENGEAYYTEGLAQMLKTLSDLKFLAHIPDAKEVIIKLKDLLISKIKKQLEIDKYLTEDDLNKMLNGLIKLKEIKELKSLQETSLVDSLKGIDFSGLMNTIVARISEVEKSEAKTKDLMRLAKKTGKTLPKDRVIIDTAKKGTTMYTGKTNKEINEIQQQF